MIWLPILLSISGYGWYLVFAHNITAGYPNIGPGLLGLFILGIFPAVLGFTANRHLLKTGTTVFKVTLLNCLYYFLYALITALPAAISLLSWAGFVLPATWQLSSWLLGTYFFYHSAEYSPDSDISNLKVAEVSLAIFIPAVFLLTYMEFPPLLPAATLAFWFVTFSLTLAVGGRDVAGNSVIRHDIIFFHALVPTLAAVMIFFAAFSREFHLLLLAAQKTLAAFIMYIFNLLSWLLGQPTQADFEPPFDFPTGGFMPEETVLVREMPFWLLLPFLALGLLLLLQAVLALINLLRTRLRPVSINTGKPPSLSAVLRQACKWLFQLTRLLFKGIFTCAAYAKTRARMVHLKLIKIWRRWLPARTPYQQILRSYEAFLRFGRKSGHPRKASETPLEYARRLQAIAHKSPFPGEEIWQLTCLFLKARYSSRCADWLQAAESRILVKKILAK